MIVVFKNKKIQNKCDNLKFKMMISTKVKASYVNNKMSMHRNEN